MMGVYHEVKFECPKCGEYIYKQSKALGGHFWHDESSVPKEIAGDIIGEYVYCDKCDRSFKIKVKHTDNVSLELSD